MPQTHTIVLAGGHQVTARHYPASGSPLATFVLAHGAGAGQTSPFITEFAAGLSARGLQVVTFNFLYTERGRKLPDPQPVLESCYRAVLQFVATDRTLSASPLFIGGKSMGGRMASHLAASQDAGGDGPPGWWARLRGLVFFGYPLHPPARPQQLRITHLSRIDHPMLFVQGEKDAFGTPQELKGFLDVLAASCTLHPVPGAGHSLDVPKRLGVPQAELHAHVQDTVVAWMRAQLTTVP